MDIKQDSIEHCEMMLWDALNAVSNAKVCVKSSHTQLKEELKILQNELMEASEWIQQK
jgi:hypothetical protein